MWGCFIYAQGAPDLTFSGNSLRPVEIIPERSTGIDKIYVLYSTENVELSYHTSSPASVKIYRYSNLGGAFSEVVSNIEKYSDKVVIKSIQGNLGYIIEDGVAKYYYWIVNYLPYRFSVDSISLSEDNQCDYTVLNINANADPINYYTITGQQKVLDREISLIYDNQEWDNESQQFVIKETKKMYESLSHNIMLSPPVLCSTSFTIRGDKFLKAWNWEVLKESSVVSPKAVYVMSTAQQNGIDYSSSTSENDTDNSDDDTDGENEDESNIIRIEIDGLGGSAPSTICFKGFASEGVIHHEWQMSSDVDFENIEYRFNQQDLEYTFTDEGTFYVRYVGSNVDGSCESYGDTYIVTIGGSELLCPNAFSPDGDGINDKWKVAYRSLLEFKCWIFDRYGKLMFYFDDPNDGWNGMRGDKPVKPGVYYYVIQAEGADGIKYKKSGDINIIRHRNPSSSSVEVD